MLRLCLTSSFPPIINILLFSERSSILYCLSSFFYNVLTLNRHQEFVHLSTGTSFSQPCRLTTRSPNSILGFFWPSASEVVYVTTHGIELFKLEDAKTLKNVKTEKNAISWFSYSVRMQAPAASIVRSHCVPRVTTTAPVSVADHGHQ